LFYIEKVEVTNLREELIFLRNSSSDSKELSKRALLFPLFSCLQVECSDTISQLFVLEVEREESIFQFRSLSQLESIEDTSFRLNIVLICDFM